LEIEKIDEEAIVVMAEIQANQVKKQEMEMQDKEQNENKV